MRKFCKDLKKHATEIIISKKRKKIIPLIEKQEEKYEKQKCCRKCNEMFNEDLRYRRF